MLTLSAKALPDNRAVLEGTDHLLFILCLVILLKRWMAECLSRKVFAEAIDDGQRLTRSAQSCPALRRPVKPPDRRRRTGSHWS